MNPYDVLGVTEQDAPDQIERAYKKLRMRAHPDHGGSAEEFDKLQRAYQTLSTPSLRALYDDHGYVGELSEDNSHRATAFDALVLMMNQYVEDPNVEFVDLRAHMIENVKQVRKSTEKAMRVTRAKASKRLRLARRWRSVNGRNPLANALEREAKKLMASLQESETVLKLNDSMERILLTEFEYAGGTEADQAASGQRHFFRRLPAPGSAP